MADKSILDQVRNERFDRRCRALIGQYELNIELLVLETTKEFFRNMKTPDKLLVRYDAPSIKNIGPGKFYIIRYDFNKIKYFIPVLVMDVKFVKNRWIAHCLNMDYLYYKYKISLFNRLYNTYDKSIDRSEDRNDVKLEDPLGRAHGELYKAVYKYLKAIGQNFAISAYHIDNMGPAYRVSLHHMERFMFFTGKHVNGAIMKSQLQLMQDEAKKIGLQKLIEEFEILNEQSYEKVEQYYKRLSAMESNLRALK